MIASRDMFYIVNDVAWSKSYANHIIGTPTAKSGIVKA